MSLLSNISELSLAATYNKRNSDHVNTIVTKAYQTACLILRCFESKEPSLLFRAFTTYVRSLREYNSPVWSPSIHIL